MYLIDQKECVELVRELETVVGHRDTNLLDKLAVTLRGQATSSLVLGVVAMGLRTTTQTLAEGVYFQDGRVTLANNSAFALDLRYAFPTEGTSMLPTGERSRLLARAADVVIANVGPKLLEGVRYEIDQEVCFDEFDASASLKNLGRFALEPGESLVVRGGRDVASLENMSDVRFLSLMLAPKWSLDWIFDRDTLRPVAKSVAHADDSQLVTCLEVASWLQTDCLHGAVESLLSHPAHFVRWKAVQSLGALGHADTVKILHEASAKDRHPDVRRAALSTIARLAARSSA